MGAAKDYTRGLTSERLKWLLRYEPETGTFYRQVHDKRGRAKDGSRAGSVGNRGYIKVSVDNQLYLAHRLAWFYVLNEWPAADVDHRNGVRDDNRWANLRSASRSENLANSKVKRKGLKGVYVQTKSGRWAARIRRNGVVHYLGTYDTEYLAHTAYCTAAAVTHGEFARFE